MRMYRHIIISAILVIVHLSSLCFAKITATVNAQTVVEGESFQLTLMMDEMNIPDLSPLQKDFIILGTSESTHYRIINGNASSSYALMLTITPKRTGTLTIPPISAGSFRSKAIDIKVVSVAKMPQSSNVSNNGINITARLNGRGKKFYQFQEIPLTVRIEISAPARDLQLSEPATSAVELIQQGEDRHSEIVRNGQRVEVIERDYILRPQQTGKLSLPPFALRGLLPDPHYQDPMAGFNSHFDELFNDPFFANSQFGSGRGRGKPFVKASNGITFNVSAPPNTQSGEWFLPAQSVSLDARWHPQNPTFKKGEAVTRVVRLVALGASEEQLPTLTFDSVDGAKIYVDEDHTLAKQTAQGEQAIRQVTLSVVPTRSGNVSLPQVSVKWLNTETDETMTAILPGEQIYVEDDPIQANVTPTLPTTAAQATSKSQPQPQSQSAVQQQQSSSTKSATTEQSQSNTETTLAFVRKSVEKYWWLLLILAIIPWLGFFFAMLLKKRNLHRTETVTLLMPENDPKLSIQPKDTRDVHHALKEQLAQACNDKSNEALYQVLLRLQREVPVMRDSAVVRVLKDALEKILFANGAEQHVPRIDFAAAEREIAREWSKLVKENSNQPTNLPPLYR